MKTEGKNEKTSYGIITSWCPLSSGYAIQYLGGRGLTHVCTLGTYPNISLVIQDLFP